MDMKVKFTGDVRSYEKIVAIKAFRKLTDFGLKESKEFIERVVEVGPQRVSFAPPPPTETSSSATRMKEGIDALEFVSFKAVSDFNTSDNHSKVLNELKKLIKMAVEHDENEIAIALLSVRDKLS